MLTTHSTPADRQPRPHNRAPPHRSLHHSVLFLAPSLQLPDHMHWLAALAGHRPRASIFHRWLLSGRFRIPWRLDDHVTSGAGERRSPTGEEAAMVNLYAGVDLRCGSGRLGRHFAIGGVSVLGGGWTFLVAFPFTEVIARRMRIRLEKDAVGGLLLHPLSHR
jgi:hypothetical protein